MRPGKNCSLHVTHMQGIVKSVLYLKLVSNKRKEWRRLELEHLTGLTDLSFSNLISYIVMSCSRTGVQLVQNIKNTQNQIVGIIKRIIRS